VQNGPVTGAPQFVQKLAMFFLRSRRSATRTRSVAAAILEGMIAAKARAGPAPRGCAWVTAYRRNTVAYLVREMGEQVTNQD